GLVAVSDNPCSDRCAALAWRRYPVVAGTNARELQHRANITELELKIVELLMQSAAPHAAHRRWELLREIYLDRLSRSFVTNVDKLDKNKFEHFPGPRLPEMRMALFNALAQKAGSHRVFYEEQDREWFIETLHAAGVVHESKRSEPLGDAPAKT